LTGLPSGSEEVSAKWVSVLCLVALCAVMLSGQSAMTRDQLLPTGKLRVGINAGNPLTRVVGKEIARELAIRLRAEAVFIEYPSPGAVADGVGKQWDIAFIAADPDREGAIAFTQPYVELDAAYLVAAASPIRSLADIDRRGVRIATGPTSAYTLVLKRELMQAELVFLGPDEAVNALAAGTVQAMAGLRFDLDSRAAADPRVRVLPETFARAQQAVALPKANAAALTYVTEFLAESKRRGTIAAAIARTGLTGATVVP
jgi:polar amino acid transport system substrate-binding protein